MRLWRWFINLCAAVWYQHEEVHNQAPEVEIMGIYCTKCGYEARM